jgi:hypothetical protein
MAGRRNGDVNAAYAIHIFSTHPLPSHLSQPYLNNMSSTHTDTDATLLRKFVNHEHSKAVGGAVNSDDSDDDRAILEVCKEQDPTSDTADVDPAYVPPGKPVCICGSCNRMHYLKIVVGRPEVSGSTFTTFPSTLPPTKLSSFRKSSRTRKGPFSMFFTAGPLTTIFAL